MAVEQHDVKFMRDAHNDRIYNEQDLAAFQLMKKLIASGHTTVEAGRQAALLLKSERELRVKEGELLAVNDRQLFEEMSAHIEAQAAELAEVNRKLSQVMAALNRLELAQESEEVEPVESTPAPAKDKPGLLKRWFGRERR